MNRRVDKVLLVGLFVVISVTLTGAQQEWNPDDFKFGVKVFVTADGILENTIESYINRELRSLGDVSVGEDNAWGLRIVAIKDESRGGRHLGYTLAVAYTKWTQPMVPDVYVDLLLKPSGDANWLDRLRETVRKPVLEYEHLSVHTGGDEDLKKMCRRIVVIFDSDLLGPARRSLNELKKNMK